MRFTFPERFFVTGTDTGVGKTFVCALLACGLDAYYWKPVQSGALNGLDSVFVREMGGIGKEKIIPETYVLGPPFSPHLAAEMETTRVELELINHHDKPGPLIIEGAGGVMVPLNDDSLIIDLIESMALPVLIVALNRLGVINHTLLTIEALRKANICVLGVILNQAVNNDNKRAVEHYGNTEVLAQIEQMDSLTPTGFKEKFYELFL